MTIQENKLALNKNLSKTAELLLTCEENNLAPKYFIDPNSYKNAKTGLFEQFLPLRTEPITYKTTKEEIFVVSDLHIAGGKNSVGVYKGTENFFADDSFYRFLEYAAETKKSRNAILILNGDVFDFIRVVDYPGRVRKVRLSRVIKQMVKMNPVPEPPAPSKETIESQFEVWQRELERIGIQKTVTDLQESISEKEKMVGLRTDDFKSVLKLYIISEGHEKFFEALAKWLSNNNKLIIVKGNHDLEWCWLAVRNYFRLILAGRIEENTKRRLEDILKNTVLPNITFVDDAILIDGDFYVEHGHRYDKFTHVLDEPFLLKSKSQLNIPFGSFFNRYLLNRIELFYPFLDNVRPSGNVLPILMRENFPLGLKVLTQHIPLTFRIIFFTNFRYVRFMFNKVFWFIIALVLPLAAAVYLNYNLLTKIDLSQFQNQKGIGSILFDQSLAIASIFFSYVIARFVAWFQLTEPSSLDKYAKIRFENTNYRIMTMGHTHNPGQYVFEFGDEVKNFYNTGTWIPVIENSTAEIREDKTFTFLHLIRDDNNKLQVSDGCILLRWNDNALRADPQVLLQRK